MKWSGNDSCLPLAAMIDSSSLRSCLVVLSRAFPRFPRSAVQLVADTDTYPVNVEVLKA